MTTKTCTKCGEEKCEEDFSFQSKKHGLRQKHCKVCASEAQKRWREDNRVRARTAAREAYKKKVIEAKGAPPREYKQNGVASYRSKGVFTRNKHLNNLFSKLPAEIQDACEAFYRICTVMNKVAGSRTYHVDHIVPINGENISGLHVPWNLRITFASENIDKSNKLIPEYWDDSVPTNIEDYVHDVSTLPTFVDWERARWPLDK